MSKWDNLPDEILKNIINELGAKEEVLQTERMLVNKQWYDLYQPIKYKEITFCFDLLVDYILFDSIVSSKFKPVKWVESLTFKNLNTARLLNSFMYDEDPLHLLKSRCANVKHVTLSFSQDYVLRTEDWTYFSTVITGTNDWKLESYNG
jgi:hypothetical protein